MAVHCCPTCVEATNIPPMCVQEAQQNCDPEKPRDANDHGLGYGRCNWEEATIWHSLATRIWKGLKRNYKTGDVRPTGPSLLQRGSRSHVSLACSGGALSCGSDCTIGHALWIGGPLPSVCAMLTAFALDEGFQLA